MTRFALRVSIDGGAGRRRFIWNGETKYVVDCVNPYVSIYSFLFGLAFARGVFSINGCPVKKVLGGKTE